MTSTGPTGEAGQPAAFPNCRACAVWNTAAPNVCWTCFRHNAPRPSVLRCGVCTRALDQQGQCANWLCRDPGRQFDRIYAAGDLRGDVYRKVMRLKEPGTDEQTWGWAVVFGRVLVKLIDTHYTPDEVGLVVASPGNPGRNPDQTRLLLSFARQLANIDWASHDWPWDHPNDPAIVRTREVPSMRSVRSIHGRTVNAQRLREALHIAHPERVQGRVLVIDDVFTSGHTLNEVSRVLRQAGATAVDGVVVARTPGW